MFDALSRIPWPLVLFLCLFLGLAPFSPPHLVEKLLMLRDGELRRAIDWFDLLLHASPWVLLAAKAAVSLGNLRHRRGIRDREKNR